MENIEQSKKPPLGLVPKWVRQRERYYEICQAIARYYDADKQIPIEWIVERNDLLEQLNDKL
jgi:hypothetical protein